MQEFGDAFHGVRIGAGVDLVEDGERRGEDRGLYRFDLFPFPAGKSVVYGAGEKFLGDADFPGELAEFAMEDDGILLPVERASEEFLDGDARNGER